MIVSTRTFIRTRNASDKICRETQNTHFMFNNDFPKYRAVYEIILTNTVVPERPLMTISYWITKTTDKDSEYVKPIALPLQQTLH
jgi:hypothetical protein